MKKSLLSISLAFTLVAADNVVSEAALNANIFVTDDAVINTQPSSTYLGCRKVANGYFTRVVGFNASTGTTSCDVYDSSWNKLENVSASQVNKATIAAVKVDQVAVENDTTYKNLGVDSFFQPFNSINFGRFLTGVITLDESVLNVKSTIDNQTLTEATAGSTFGNNVVGSEIEAEIVSATDAINKDNLYYYIAMINAFVGNNNDNAYRYLQTMFLAMVMAMSIFILGGRALMHKLSKSQDNISKELMQAAAVGVIGILIFFAPLPTSSGIQSTTIQAVIRFFVAESTAVADKINQSFLVAYLKKLNVSAGVATKEAQSYILTAKNQAGAIAVVYQPELQRCYSKFPGVKSFQVNDQQIADIDKLDNINDRTKTAASASGCRDIERNYLIAKKTYYTNDEIAKRMQNGLNNASLKTRLQSIEQTIANYSTQMGWMSSIFASSTAIWLDNISAFNSSTSSADNIESRIKAAMDKDDKSWWDKLKDGASDKTKELVSTVVSKFSIFILPGSKPTYDYLNMLVTDGGSVITGILGSILGGSPITGMAGVGIYKVLTMITGGIFQAGAALLMTTMVMMKMLSYVPFLAATAAGTIMVLFYFVDLAKYFFISPFVVLWSITMKANTNQKIVEFLVTGMQLFIKPVLIVFFCYFALFLYQISIDLFSLLTKMQMAIVDIATNVTDFSALAGLGLALGLFQIVTILASTFVVWKTITGGPDFVFKMFGSDKIINGAAEFGREMQQKLNKFTDPAN